MMGFAHRGAPTMSARENTLPAFLHALGRGATGLESDVWLTFDGVPVLVHDRLVRAGFRRRPIDALTRRQLPKWLPALSDLYDEAGTDFDLSLDVKDVAAAEPTVNVAESRGAADRLWLCGSAAAVRSWQPFIGAAHPVVSTSLRVSNGRGRRLDESRIEEAAAARAAAVNLRAPEWNADRVRRCHELGMLAFAWDVQEPRVLATVRSYGCDGFYSDYLTLLATA